jgi:hypothetical protein
MSLSNAERQARWRAKRAAKIHELEAEIKKRKSAQIDADPLRNELAAAKAEIERLKAQAKASNNAPTAGLARTRGTFEFGEAAKLRVENARLRARIKLLAPTVDGEAIKLRKEVEELRGERFTLKQVLRKTAKERDQALQSGANWRKYHKLRSTESRFEPRVFRTIAKCLHEDRLEKCSKAELDEAVRLFLELRPLFE